jgi:basic membrane protein A
VALVVVATAVVVLVQAGSGEEAEPRPTSTIGTGTHVCVVVGTPGPEGGRFRVPLSRALWKAHRELGTTGSLVEAHRSGLDAAIERFVARGCDLIAATGVEAGEATAQAARQHPAQHFALIGGTARSTIPNVTAVHFHTEQAAFVAGYLAAALTRTGILGAFGSERTPEVTGVLDAYSAGVQRLNQDRDLAIALNGWDSLVQSGLFTDAADDPGAGKRAAQHLIGDGSDILLAVAGNAARGAAGVAHGVGDAWMIGTGWDWAQTASAPKLWITTIQDRAAVMLRALIAREVRNQFRPGVLNATLANGGVGLAKLRGPAEFLSDNLTHDLQVLGQEVARGTVSTDPDDYPPPPVPGATPSGGATAPGEDGE